MRIADIPLWVASVADADAEDDDGGAHDTQSAGQYVYLDGETGVPIPSKRRRVINDSDDDDLIGRPLPMPYMSASDFDEASMPPGPQMSTSDAAVARYSSLSRQLENAKLQPTGFHRAPFTNYNLSGSLKLLADDLGRIRTGYGILPKSLRADLENVYGIFPFYFGDDDSGASAFRYPPLKHVRLILEHAKKCSEHRHSETSWNVEVHARLLEWVLRTAPGSDGPLDFRYCVHATILDEYQPKYAPSKLVDFCLPIEINEEEKSIIDNLRLIRPDISINHTDWGDLDRCPIAVSIATGVEIGFLELLVQMGTWHAAQWRSLFYGGSNAHAIEFLPGVIVVGHYWSFVATVPGKDGGKPTILKMLPIGSTDSVFEIYKLIAILQRLKEWAEKVFWPAFKECLMDLPQEGGSGKPE